MSEGFVKRHRRETRKKKFGGDSVLTPQEKVFAMPDLVYVHIAVHFHGCWKDHLALAHSTSRLWRYWGQRDAALKWMRYVFGGPRGLQWETRRQMILDSGLLLCYDWLWYRDVRTSLVTEVAEQYQSEGASHGNMEIVRRYGALLGPEGAEKRALLVFSRACERGHDEFALQLAQLPRPNPMVTEALLSHMASYAHRVPKTFDFLWNRVMAQQDNEYGWRSFALTKSCKSDSVNIDAFQWMWHHRFGGGDKKLAGMFLDHALFLILQNHVDAISVARLAARLWLIARHVFGEWSTWNDVHEPMAVPAEGTRRVIQQKFEFSARDLAIEDRNWHPEPYTLVLTRTRANAYGEVRVGGVLDRADGLHANLPAFDLPYALT